MILLTGASGFVGKHMLKELISKYGTQNVVAYTSKPIPGVQCILHDGYKIKSFEFTNIGLGDIKTIIHAGASTPKTKTEVDDKLSAELNIHVTDQLLKANLPNLKRFVYLSTLDVYSFKDIIDETTALTPSSAYAKSKLHGEELVYKWTKLQQGRIGQILRLGHIYGPGEEKFRKIIPETMRRLLKGQPIEIFGTGHERRAFIYIDDVVRALMAALELKHDIGPVNIAGEKSISIIELVKLLIEISGNHQPIKQIQSPVGHDMVFNTAKLATYLLNDEISLQKGLQIEWDYMKSESYEDPY